jgi:hypothetical protein
MSKTPQKNNRYEYDDDDDYAGEAAFRAEARQHKKEKKMKTALRTMDIDYLSDFEDDED